MASEHHLCKSKFVSRLCGLDLWWNQVVSQACCSCSAAAASSTDDPIRQTAHKQSSRPLFLVVPNMLHLARVQRPAAGAGVSPIRATRPPPAPFTTTTTSTSDTFSSTAADPDGVAADVGTWPPSFPAAPATGSSPSPPPTSLLAFLPLPYPPFSAAATPPLTSTPSSCWISSTGPAPASAQFDGTDPISAGVRSLAALSLHMMVMLCLIWYEKRATERRTESGSRRMLIKM